MYPVGMILFNIVQLLFHISGVTYLKDLRKRLYQFIGDDLAQVVGIKSFLVFFHIFAVLNDLDDLGIGAGSPDTLRFELFHQRCL